MRQQLHGKLTAGVVERKGFVPVPPGTSRQLRVRIDGDALRGVVAVDTWAGWVDFIPRDDHGEYVVKDGEPRLERRHGRVEAHLVDASFADIDYLTRAGLALG